MVSMELRNSNGFCFAAPSWRDSLKGNVRKRRIVPQPRSLRNFRRMKLYASDLLPSALALDVAGARLGGMHVARGRQEIGDAGARRNFFCTKCGRHESDPEALGLWQKPLACSKRKGKRTSRLG